MSVVLSVTLMGFCAQGPARREIALMTALFVWALIALVTQLIG